ncbi:hypothetical protein ZOSMA_194G00150 [Zostera marina]|uniref:Uncharacterized protein n=1 Tax=Zostera marina TaxID=29655 RepID=A0A0K9PRB0_ZOSMR|nr:hypothetical protein ZOSMA_194G00150 [Zostera marina]
MIIFAYRGLSHKLSLESLIASVEIFFTKRLRQLCYILKSPCMMNSKERVLNVRINLNNS